MAQALNPPLGNAPSRGSRPIWDCSA